ncbi:MAG: archaeosine biosynthesis radical SAM protein RaSEA [Promethearchaeota archaeon]
MKKSDSNYNKSLTEKVYFLRQKAFKKKKIYTKAQLNIPISFWIKRDRLLEEIGKEFTIILRSRGCSWALKDHGGCSMCGYIRDANIEDVPPDQIINQFDYALNNKLSEIKNDTDNYVLKIFNSGSFFDNFEIVENIRKYIYQRIAKLDKIKEFVLESRVEYITQEKLIELKKYIKDKYIEIGVGLETVDDHIRDNFINKGLPFSSFKKALQLCKEHDIGVKAYLLFKPPFVNEQGAIDDCVNSIKKLMNLKVNSISINPLNIQKNTLTEYLWFQNRYRPPWYYSLFKSLSKALSQKDLKTVRILSDPSGAGTKRGIHNCLKRECEFYAKETLRKFVLNQELSILNQEAFDCNCKKIYQLQKSYY